MNPNELDEVIGVLTAEILAFSDVDWHNKSNSHRLEAVKSLAAIRRYLFAISGQIGASLADMDPAELGGEPHVLVSNALGIGLDESKKRLVDAKLLRAAPRN